MDVLDGWPLIKRLSPQPASLADAPEGGQGLHRAQDGHGHGLLLHRRHARTPPGMVVIGEWINEFERQSLNRRNPSSLEPQLVKNVLAVRDSPCINPLT